MSIIVPSAGSADLLDDLLAELDSWVHLYVVDTVLGPTTVASDLTEASWPGYVPKRVTTWTPALTPTDYAYSTADPVMWTYPGGGPTVSVFGYWVSDGQTGPLAWCERRPQGPIVLVLPTDVVVVMPRLTLRQDPIAE